MEVKDAENVKNRLGFDNALGVNRVHRVGGIVVYWREDVDF